MKIIAHRTNGAVSALFLGALRCRAGHPGLKALQGLDREKLEKEYILCTKKDKYGYTCLTNQKQYFMENHPDIVIEKIAIDEIPAYGESEALKFKVKAPQFNSCRKLEPINFIYRGNRDKLIGSTPVKSPPAVEMVWFQTEPQNEPEKEFKVK